MKELTGSARNLFYRKDDDGKMEAHVELILVVSEPVFQLTNTGSMMKERRAETIRIVTNKRGIEELAATLAEILPELEGKEKP